MDPFRPQPGKTVNIDVAATSASVQVSSDTGVVQIRVMNNGSATAWIKFGTSAPTAVATSDIPIGSGACEVFSVSGPTYAAAIAVGATGKVYFTPGEGV